MKRNDGNENRPTTFDRDYVAALVQLKAVLVPLTIEWPNWTEYKFLPINTINGMKLSDYINLQLED